MQTSLIHVIVLARTLGQEASRFSLYFCPCRTLASTSTTLPLIQIIISGSLIRKKLLRLTSGNKNFSPILCSQFLYSPYHREEVWRYFTYSFTHSGIAHLASNLVLQILIGMLLEVKNPRQEKVHGRNSDGAWHAGGDGDLHHWRH